MVENLWDNPEWREKHLDWVKNEDHSDLAIHLGTGADIGKYVTWVYGVSHAVGNDLQLDKVIYAGIGYAVCAFLGRIAASGIAHEEWKKIVSTLETKLRG